MSPHSWCTADCSKNRVAHNLCLRPASALRNITRRRRTVVPVDGISGRTSRHPRPGVELDRSRCWWHAQVSLTPGGMSGDVRGARTGVVRGCAPSLEVLRVVARPGLRDLLRSATPVRCPGSQTARMLTGWDTAGTPICRDCTESVRDSSTNTEASRRSLSAVPLRMLHARRHLAGSSPTPPGVTPSLQLITGLLEMDRHASRLIWLRNAHAVRFLRSPGQSQHPQTMACTRKRPSEPLRTADGQRRVATC